MKKLITIFALALTVTAGAQTDSTLAAPMFYGYSPGSTEGTPYKMTIVIMIDQTTVSVNSEKVNLYGGITKAEHLGEMTRITCLMRSGRGFIVWIKPKDKMLMIDWPGFLRFNIPNYTRKS